ncbi:hypothetical protein [Pelagibius sp. Alg239-R121]|uniref:hypothetical protein n=1 Tax=Pelagibius sp. Alg239-R121 TaxID=2993448 RepID=UPI0024A75067|nr:hypothetical protein [Pelagibius sp. Alg239-R121]
MKTWRKRRLVALAICSPFLFLVGVGVAYSMTFFLRLLRTIGTEGVPIVANTIGITLLTGVSILALSPLFGRAVAWVDRRFL